ncbi:Bifunctional protein HldE [subsurface metagenome]
MKVLVIGDAIIDEYHHCEPMGKSPKESIITTRYLHEEAFAGGALAAANHIAGFCECVHLITLLGAENSQEKFIQSHLRSNVKAKFFYREDAPTPTKRRYIDPFLAKMFAVYHLNNSDLSPYYESEICNYIDANIQKYDVVLVADFGHGFIGPQIIELVCNKAPFLAVTAQTNSANVGFNLITKYPRADYMCLDSLELRLACHDKFGELKALVPRIGRLLSCNNVAITRGNDGSLTYLSQDGFFEVPALTDRAVDRLGAGDAYLAITTPCVARGYPMDMVGFIGNAVGALQVQIIGNKESVEPAALFKFIKALLK